MGKLTKEDIILLFLNDPQEVSSAIWDGNISKSDEIRTLICDLGDPRCTWFYSYWVDKSPRNDTRSICCKDPGWAYEYARHVDKSPRSDTRSAAYKDSYWKERYEQWENSIKKT